MNIGAHVSIAGGIFKAPKRAHDLGCECFQIFSRSPRGGKAPVLSDDIVERFHSECSLYGLDNYYIHVPYYTNLASDDKSIRSTSIAITAEELERADAIRAKSIVLHPGSARDRGKRESVLKVAEGINAILSSARYSALLLIENTAGQGAVIGDTFEELAEILDAVDNPGIGVCLDTAHLLASGYDIRTPEGVADVINRFDRTVGLERLKLIHANDSKVGLGERKDRHEHIGNGKIGLEGFMALVRSTLLSGIDIVVETEPGKGADGLDLLKEDIEKLQGMRDR